MAWILLSSRLDSSLCLCLCAAVAGEDKQQNTFSSSALGTPMHNMSWGMIRGTCLIFQSCLGLQRVYKELQKGDAEECPETV
jgi:hypothetical protein